MREDLQGVYGRSFTPYSGPGCISPQALYQHQAEYGGSPASERLMTPLQSACSAFTYLQGSGGLWPQAASFGSGLPNSLYGMGRQWPSGLSAASYTGGIPATPVPARPVKPVAVRGRRTRLDAEDAHLAQTLMELKSKDSAGSSQRGLFADPSRPASAADHSAAPTFQRPASAAATHSPSFSPRHPPRLLSPWEEPVRTGARRPRRPSLKRAAAAALAAEADGSDPHDADYDVAEDLSARCTTRRRSEGQESPVPASDISSYASDDSAGETPHAKRRPPSSGSRSRTRTSQTRSPGLAARGRAPKKTLRWTAALKRDLQAAVEAFQAGNSHHAGIDWLVVLQTMRAQAEGRGQQLDAASFSTGALDRMYRTLSNAAYNKGGNPHGRRKGPRTGTPMHIYATYALLRLGHICEETGAVLYQGNLHCMASQLEEHPVISPTLDMEPRPGTKVYPRYKDALLGCFKIGRYKCLSRLGEDQKINGQLVYCLDKALVEAHVLRAVAKLDQQAAEAGLPPPPSFDDDAQDSSAPAPGPSAAPEAPVPDCVPSDPSEACDPDFEPGQD